MTPRITPAEIEVAASQAALHLNPGEAEQYAHQLGAILTAFEYLEGLDLDGVEPLAQLPPQSGELRADRVEPGLTPEAALSQAPESQEGFFKVPPVIE